MWTITIIILIAFILVIIGDTTKLKGLVPIGTCMLGMISLIYTFLYFSIDYKLQLNPSGTIEISDKHGNTNRIELDSLEEFILKDNL